MMTKMVQVSFQKKSLIDWMNEKYFQFDWKRFFVVVIVEFVVVTVIVKMVVKKVEVFLFLVCVLKLNWVDKYQKTLEKEKEEEERFEKKSSWLSLRRLRLSMNQ